MAFMRTINATRSFLTVLRPIRNDYIFAANIARMSTRATFIPSSASYGFNNNAGGGRDYGGGDKTKKSAIMAALLTCGGVGYLFKNLADGKFGSESRALCAEGGQGGDGCKTCRDCEDSVCLHKMDKEEETILKANHDLECALKDVKPKTTETTEAALLAFCEATELIKLFMDKAYCAIGQDCLESPKFEEVWCDVYETAVKRCEKVTEALRKANCAWELICRLREIIKNGKCCKYTQCNPLLITAEQTVLCAERELLNARAKMDCVQSDNCMVEQYRALIDAFKGDLKCEVAAFLSENPDCGCNANECVQMITEAYKKVLKVQKELAQNQICTGQVPCEQQKNYLLED